MEKGISWRCIIVPACGGGKCLGCCKLFPYLSRERRGKIFSLCNKKSACISLSLSRPRIRHRNNCRQTRPHRRRQIHRLYFASFPWIVSVVRQNVVGLFFPLDRLSTITDEAGGKIKIKLRPQAWLNVWNNWNCIFLLLLRFHHYTSGKERTRSLVPEKERQIKEEK